MSCVSPKLQLIRLRDHLTVYQLDNEVMCVDQLCAHHICYGGTSKSLECLFMHSIADIESAMNNICHQESVTSELKVTTTFPVNLKMR